MLGSGRFLQTTIRRATTSVLQPAVGTALVDNHAANTRPRTRETPLKSRACGRLVRLTLAAGAIFAALTVWGLLPVRAWTTALAEGIRGAGLKGILLFVVVYVTAEVALAPGSLLTMAAGFAYGPVRGLLVASPASVLAATVAFLLGRTILRDWIENKIARSPKARALDRAVERNSLKLIVLLRLSPVIPFNILELRARSLERESRPIRHRIVRRDAARHLAICLPRVAGDHRRGIG